jgi:cytochrome P450
VEGLVSPTAPERTRDPAEVVFAWFRTMLTTDPVHRDEHDLWHVFGYADVVRILSDPATFSSDVRELNPRQQDVDLFAKGNFASMDPPRHRKLRGLVSRVFTPRVVAGLAPRIEQITTGLLDEVAGRTEFDLVDTLAYPLPVTVIAELLGVPAADMPQFRRWAEGLFSVQVDASTLPNEDLVAQVAPIIREMNGYLLGHIRLRRSRGGEDLLAGLTTACCCSPGTSPRPRCSATPCSAWTGSPTPRHRSEPTRACSLRCSRRSCATGRRSRGWAG